MQLKQNLNLMNDVWMDVGFYCKKRALCSFRKIIESTYIAGRQKAASFMLHHYWLIHLLLD